MREAGVEVRRRARDSGAGIDVGTPSKLARREMLDVRRWRLWDAWLNYVGLTVLRDAGGGGDISIRRRRRRSADVVILKCKRHSRRVRV
jgi:hypothetical protein